MFFKVKYDKRYVYDVDLIKIKEKKELLNETPLTLNKFIISNTIPESEQLLKSKLVINELNQEDKQNILKSKAIGIPSNRQDVHFI